MVKSSTDADGYDYNGDGERSLVAVKREPPWAGGIDGGAGIGSELQQYPSDVVSQVLVAPGEPMPLTTIPIFIDAIESPLRINRETATEVLCRLVSESSGAGGNGDAIGTAVREAGGMHALSGLLTDVDEALKARALYLISNLASDALDRRSYLSKKLLWQAKTLDRLLPCLNTTKYDEETVCCACAAILNLSGDSNWASALMLREMVLPTLQQLARHPNEKLAQYAYGAIANLTTALRAAVKEMSEGGTPEPPLQIEMKDTIRSGSSRRRRRRR